MARKPLSQSVVLGLTAATAFSLLFVTQLVTQPIILNHENQAYLTLLNLDSFVGYTIGETEITTGELRDAGIHEVKTFMLNDQIMAVTYSVQVRGYAPGLTYRLGIRQGLIQQFVVDAHAETQGYGANALGLFPEALTLLPIANEASWTQALVGQSAGATITRRAIINSLQLIQRDYAERTSS